MLQFVNMCSPPTFPLTAALTGGARTGGDTRVRCRSIYSSGLSQGLKWFRSRKLPYSIKGEIANAAGKYAN
jgi:hypothetical protein